MFNSSLRSDSGSRLIQNQFAFNSSLGSNICSILFLEIHVRVNSSFEVNSLELLACNFFEWVSLAYPFRTYSRVIRHIRVWSEHIRVRSEHIRVRSEHIRVDFFKSRSLISRNSYHIITSLSRSQILITLKSINSLTNLFIVHLKFSFY